MNIFSLSVVATEGSNFCKHTGLDIKKIYKVVTRGEKRGESTMTQQLAKNLFYGLGNCVQEKWLNCILSYF